VGVLPSRVMLSHTNRHHPSLLLSLPSSLPGYSLAIRAPRGIEEDGHVRRPLLQVVQQLFRREGNDGLLLLLCFSLCGAGGGGGAVAGHGEEEEAEETEEEDEEEGQAGDRGGRGKARETSYSPSSSPTGCRCWWGWWRGWLHAFGDRLLLMCAACVRRAVEGGGGESRDREKG